MGQGEVGGLKEGIKSVTRMNRRRYFLSTTTPRRTCSPPVNKGRSPPRSARTRPRLDVHVSLR